MALYALELYPGGGQSSGDLPQLPAAAAQALDDATQLLEALSEARGVHVQVSLVVAVRD
jgi:hypothetical protein